MVWMVSVCSSVPGGPDQLHRRSAREHPVALIDERDVLRDRRRQLGTRDGNVGRDRTGSTRLDVRHVERQWQVPVLGRLIKLMVGQVCLGRLMPPSTKLLLFANGVLGSARLLSRSVSWSAVGTAASGAGAGAGAGSRGSGAPTADSCTWDAVGPAGVAVDVSPAAAAPIAAMAATPVAMDLAVFFIVGSSPLFHGVMAAL
jgi:hypothetical protein